jgi:hypothetical protein
MPFSHAAAVVIYAAFLRIGQCPVWRRPAPLTSLHSLHTQAGAEMCGTVGSGAEQGHAPPKGAIGTCMPSASRPYVMALPSLIRTVVPPCFSPFSKLFVRFDLIHPPPPWDRHAQSFASPTQICLLGGRAISCTFATLHTNVPLVCMVKSVGMHTLGLKKFAHIN